MKKLIYFAAAVLAFAACAKELAINNEPDSSAVKVSITATLDDEDVTKAELNLSSGAAQWELGDEIAVHTKLGKLAVLQAESAGASVTFSGNINAGDEILDGAVAYYPASIAIEGNAAKVNLPASYSSAAEAVKGFPLRGVISGDAVAFKHIGGLMKITVNSVPTDVTSIVLTAKKKAISGAVDVDITTATAPKCLVGASSSSISVASVSADRPSGTATLYIPVPTGELTGGISVALKEGTKTVSIKATDKNVNISRAKLFAMKPFTSAAIPEHLYIYFWEWTDVANSQEMTQIADGVFSWTGNCPEWEFKFLTSNSDYWTGYFRDDKAADYWTVREGGDQCMFLLHDHGLPVGEYTVRVDLGTMKVTVYKPDLYIYFWEWDNGGEGATNAVKMTALGDGKFTWSGICPRWNMKFTTSNAAASDYWTGYFRDASASDYWTLKRGNDEQMFHLDVLGRDGYWTINVDLVTMKVEAIPHIWLIGSAFSWGWDRDLAEEMTYLGNRQFSWTGTITNGTDGIFKFLVRKDGDWYGYWRNSTATDYWIAGEDWNNDTQFSVVEAGIATGTTVTITLNTATGAVTINPV